MDPYSELRQVRQNLEAMSKMVAGLENDILDTLKENTELKMENQLLREKLDKLTAEKAGKEVKSQSGLASYAKFMNLVIIYAICIMELTVILVQIVCFV